MAQDHGSGHAVALLEPRELAHTARAQLEDLAAAAAGYADAGVAANTRRAYAADWADFSGWCAAHAVELALERGEAAPSSAVLLYLTAQAAAGLTVSTLERRRAGIRAQHRRFGLQAPDSPELAQVWAGIKRTHGRPALKKRALVVEDLRRVVRRLPDSPAGARDRALLLVGFGAALRRSELAGLELTGAGASGPIRVAFVGGGLEIAIDRSKGDQEGRGAIVAVPFGKTLCPVSALRAWLDLAGIVRGAVFRPIDRHGRVGEGAISDRAAAEIVKRAVAGTKLDPALFGGHSLRSGLVTSALEKGAATDAIMRQTRHAKVETMLAYGQAHDRFARNAAGKLL